MGASGRDATVGRCVKMWEDGPATLASTVGPTAPRRPAASRQPAAQDDRQVSVANIKSQIKRNRPNEKRRLRNRTVRSEVNTRTKAALAAVEHDDEDADETLRLAIKRIDKAAAKGVIHKNTAARNKSRLVRKLNGQRDG